LVSAGAEWTRPWLAPNPKPVVQERAPLAPQAKLTIGAPGDRYEQEADRVAEQVMRPPAASGAASLAPPSWTAAAGTHVQRMCAGCEKEDEKIRGKPIGSSLELSPGVARGIEGTRGGGAPLPAATRAFFEPRFGHGFDHVRVHHDAGAQAMASQVNARAFTIGRDVYFNAGQYVPSTSVGQRLLAHELTHVVQQSSGGEPRIQRAEDWNFTPAEFGELKKAKGELKFDSDSSWFPAPFQKNLLDTLNALLDPTRKKPATTGVSTADFFHGHIAMKGSKSDELNKRSGEYSKVGEAEYSKALGGSRINDLTTKNLTAYKTAVTNTLPSAKAILDVASGLKDVVVIYHTFETNKPGEMKFGSPERNFITPLGGSPKGYSPPNPDSAGSWGQEFTDIFQFNFLIDEHGVIHVRPGFASSSRELSTITGKPEK
jgi:Domain of unknown function (DUF4157)